MSATPVTNPPWFTVPAEQVDWTVFDKCSVRPYPKWPLICLHTNRLSFPERAALMAWLKLRAIDALLYHAGVCKVCRQWHYECKPGEASGQSNGKGFRAAQWLVRKRAAKAEQEAALGGDDD